MNEDYLPIIGKKADNLGIIFNLGLPVPPGFVITTHVYKEFIGRTKIKSQIEQFLQGLDIENREVLQKTAKKIQNLINSTEIPEDMMEDLVDNYELLGADQRKAADLVESEDIFVAIRSSVVAEDLPQASFVGHQKTFLNVKGKEEVVNALLSCWASLFTERAIYYRQKNNFDHLKVFSSVIIQKMVNSDTSGIMFTVNPATNKKEEIVIEAIYGLGKLLSGDKVNPDFYVLDKNTRDSKQVEIKKQEIGLFRDEEGKTVEKAISKKQQEMQVISDVNLKEISRYGKIIEKHYNKPQDIEWAIENDQVYIVQARTVTTFKSKEKEEISSVKEEAGKILIKGETASAGFHTGRIKIVNDASELEKVQKGDILVTKMSFSEMLPGMQRAGAIITNQGGMTSYAATVSREIGLPCIIGTEHATETLQEGKIVTVNASKGLVYEGKVEAPQQLVPSIEQAEDSQSEIRTTTEVKVIMDLPDVAEHAAATGADGVGLVRLEIMIANSGIHPAEYIRQGREEDYVNLLKDGIRKIAKAFSSSPVWIRCSDMRSDEYRNLQGGDQEPKESDPIIGWHGIRRLLDEEQILRSEFTAIRELHYEGLKNIAVILPFVNNVDELPKAKEIMREIGLEPGKSIDFGVMIETPASCWIIEDLCKEGLSFVSFGTNSLTPFTLGLARTSSSFDELHPAVLGKIAKVISVCKKYNVKTSISGLASNKPQMAEFLVHQGIDSISANVDAVDKIRRVVAQTEKKLLGN